MTLLVGGILSEHSEVEDDSKHTVMSSTVIEHSGSLIKIQSTVMSYVTWTKHA